MRLWSSNTCKTSKFHLNLIEKLHIFKNVTPLPSKNSPECKMKLFKNSLQSDWLSDYQSCGIKSQQICPSYSFNNLQYVYLSHYFIPHKMLSSYAQYIHHVMKWWSIYPDLMELLIMDERNKNMEFYLKWWRKYGHYKDIFI